MLHALMRTWLHRFRGDLACLEKMILGRTRPGAEEAVREAIALCGTEPWCEGCGRSLGEDGGAPPAASPEVRPLCRRCRVQPMFDGFVRLGCYAPPLDRLVQRVKGNAWHDVAEAFGRALACVITRKLSTPPGGWMVVPIPSSPYRRLRRGIDHTQTMASALGTELGVRCTRCLRARSWVRQASLGRSERLQRSGLAWRGRARIPEASTVLLVDDVRTTGTTLLKARELLKGRGVGSVIPVVVCVKELT